jgi:TRAP-type C4-dicarboxylate transport system substrate-binding protein
MIDAGKYAQDEVLKYQIAEADKAKAQLMKEGIQISQLIDDAEWKKAALTKVWPEMTNFVGGKDIINAYLKAAGKQPWNP